MRVTEFQARHYLTGNTHAEAWREQNERKEEVGATQEQHT